MQFRSKRQEGSTVIKQMCLSLKTRFKKKESPRRDHHRWIQTRFDFRNDGQVERNWEGGGRGKVFKADYYNMHHISATEIGFQLQAEGSTARVTPQSTRVTGEAALQPSLTFSINSPSLSHERSLAKQKEREQQQKKVVKLER